MLTGFPDLVEKFNLEHINSCIDEILKETKTKERSKINDQREHLPAVDVIYPLGRRGQRTKLGVMRVPQLGFSDLRPGHMFWH